MDTGNVDLQDSGKYAYIGKQYSRGTSTRDWKGFIDDLCIYYRALSPQETADP